MAFRVSVERSTVSFIGILLYVICCFSLDAFNICSLCLIFVSLSNMCLRRFLLGIFPVWDSLGFLSLGGYFLPHIRKFLNIIPSNIFSHPFLLSFFPGMLMMQMLGCLTNFNTWNCPRGHWCFTHLLFFAFLYSDLLYFHHSIFWLTYPFFYLSFSTVGSLQSVLNLSYSTVHYWLTVLYLF